MANEPGSTAVAEQPAPAADFSLEKYRESKRTPVEAAPVAAAPAVVADDEAVDLELAKEIDQIAPPVKDETPQQKGARTRDYRDRARKGLASRLGNERDAARAEVARLQRELSQRAPVAAAPAGATPAASSPAPAASVVDPRDPEPTYDSFLKANPDHPDPYAGFLREQGKWDRRQETRQAAQQSRIASATSAVQQATATYKQRVETVRTAHPNYYDVVDPFVNAAKDHPLSPFITEAILGSERGPELLYRIASDRALATKVYASPSVALALKQLGMIEATLPTATQAPPASPAVVALPPAPVNPVGGSALPTSGDPTVSLSAWRKHKQAQGWRR